MAHPKWKCQVQNINKQKNIWLVSNNSGSGPIAPPRSARKSKGQITAEPSPAPSRNGTLPRKPSNTNLSSSNPMAGRPLPPPPPVGPKSSPPPPALPKKSASISQMTGIPPGARFQSSSQRQQPQPGGVPMPAGLSRRDSNRYPGAAAPLTNQYPQSQYPQSFPSPTMQTQYPTAGVQPQYPAAAAQPQYPSNSQYPQGDDWSRGVQSSYMDEMRFAPKVSEY